MIALNVQDCTNQVCSIHIAVNSPSFADVAGIAATIQGARSGSAPLTPVQVQDIMESKTELLSNYQNNPRKFTTTVGGCLGPTNAPTPAPTPPPTAPCLTGELKVTILTDDYPGETSWTVKNTCTDTTFMSGGSYNVAATTYVSEKCLPSVGRYELNIVVSSGNDHPCALVYINLSSPQT